MRNSRWLILFSMLVFPYTAVAEVFIAEKHQVLMLAPAENGIKGQYMFGVRNTGTTAEKIVTPVMLPKETADFSPEEGLEARDLSLGTDGVVMTKIVSPGIEIVSLAFRVNGSGGPITLTLVPPVEIKDLTVVLPKNSGLSLESSSFAPSQQATMGVDAKFDTYQSLNSLPAKAFVTLTLIGMPAGRAPLWYVGLGLAITLSLGGITLTAVQRPQAHKFHSL